MDPENGIYQIPLLYGTPPLDYARNQGKELTDYVLLELSCEEKQSKREAEYTLKQLALALCCEAVAAPNITIVHGVPEGFFNKGHGTKYFGTGIGMRLKSP